MVYEMKTDLRVVKTRAAIKSTIKQMICEKPLSEITVKELTERAMIHRKTFYLHYESIEDLFEDLANDIVKSYNERIDKLPPGTPFREINGTFFEFMAEQEPYVEKIFCSPEYGDVLTRMLIEMVQHNKGKDNPYKKFPWEEQEIINTYLVLGSVNIYRTWVRDGKLIPVERLRELAGNLMSNGIESILKRRAARPSESTRAGWRCSSRCSIVSGRMHTRSPVELISRCIPFPRNGDIESWAKSRSWPPRSTKRYARPARAGMWASPSPEAWTPGWSRP